MDDVTRVHTITYGDFFRDFLLENQLCVFSSEITEDWRSRKEWVTNGKPNLEFLSNRFGYAIAPVANCSQAEYNSQVKQDMSVTEFCDYWKSSFQDEKNKTEVLYLKDWHFCKAFPGYNAYETPVYFKSDWLNEFWDKRRDVTDDYRFVYMGPKGTWSYSWSANICGCKKWLLYPPGQEKYLTDRLGNLAYDVLSDDMYDGKKFPDFDKARKPITVIQREGEVIFVPSGWHHQVMNLEDTISINHNWTDACGIFKMWEHVQSELKKVEQSIADCKDMENWHEQCQMILKASCGINYEEFIEFLDVIARRRLAALSQRTVYSSQQEDNDEKKTLPAGPDFESYVFEEWKKSVDVLNERQERTWADYCRYDLSKIKECLIGVKNDQSFNDLQNLELQSRVDKLLLDIDISNQIK
ncbi:2-oxoglutarate and iron-dependent oxygenase JMJD4-like isoform X2 [Acropora palmata]|uniref:2-oxoglutarate and iron-dependent oxygenase JMJD4-like isoform X2 n=1 Tax=Acropora palmata TaxID=6131 RepID=UPI003DA1700B